MPSAAQNTQPVAKPTHWPAVAKKGVYLFGSGAQLYFGFKKTARNPQSLKGLCLTAAGFGSGIYTLMTPADQLRLSRYVEKVLGGFVSGFCEQVAGAAAKGTSWAVKSAIYFCAGAVESAFKSSIQAIQGDQVDNPLQAAIVSGVSNTCSTMAGKRVKRFIQETAPHITQGLASGTTRVLNQMVPVNILKLIGADETGKKVADVVVYVLKPVVHGGVSSAAGTLGGNATECALNRQIDWPKLTKNVPSSALKGAATELITTLGVDYFRLQNYKQEQQRLKEEWTKKDQELKEQQESKQQEIDQVNRDIEAIDQELADLDASETDAQKQIQKDENTLEKVNDRIDNTFPNSAELESQQQQRQQLESQKAQLQEKRAQLVTELAQINESIAASNALHEMLSANNHLSFWASALKDDISGLIKQGFKVTIDGVLVPTPTSTVILEAINQGKNVQWTAPKKGKGPQIDESSRKTKQHNENLLQEYNKTLKIYLRNRASAHPDQEKMNEEKKLAKENETEIATIDHEILKADALIQKIEATTPELEAIHNNPEYQTLIAQRQTMIECLQFWRQRLIDIRAKKVELNAQRERALQKSGDSQAELDAIALQRQEVESEYQAQKDAVQLLFENRKDHLTAGAGRTVAFALRDAMQEAGNCLFDNILVQLQTNETARQLRTRLVAFMRNNKEKFMSLIDYENPHLHYGAGQFKSSYRNWNSYLAALNMTGTWAGEIEVNALAEMLERSIVLLPDGNQPILNYNEQAGGDPLYLYHQDANHFVAAFSYTEIT